MIPRIIHQIWPGSDAIPERLSILMAKNARFCRDNSYMHLFWKITESGKLILCKNHTHYGETTIESLSPDPRFAAMLADPKIHYVMKGDILRFVINYVFGGYYADLDLEIFLLPERFLYMPYVCGYEFQRPIGVGNEPEYDPRQEGILPVNREHNPVCTAFFGAPEKSEINREMIEHILSMYEAAARKNQYPKSMWNVIDFTVDKLVKIIRNHPEVVPFPKEYFFDHPIPPYPKVAFTAHYYAGTQPGGWTFDQCKNEDCAKCPDAPTCKISREGRRVWKS